MLGKSILFMLNRSFRALWSVSGAGVALVSLLGAAPAFSAQLMNGKYQCYSFGGGVLSYSFVDVNILGPSSYSDRNGSAGRFETSGASIVFSTGPLARHRANVKDASNFTFLLRLLRQVFRAAGRNNGASGAADLPDQVTPEGEQSQTEVLHQGVLSACSSRCQISSRDCLKGSFFLSRVIRD